MRKVFREIFTAALGFVLILGSITVINAQESGNFEFTLEEITVTAQKREENQQKVAIAMEVLSGEELKELGNNDIDEILGNISSVLINSAPDGLRVSIRGMSNDNSTHGDLQTSKPTVAVNKDGIYTNRNTGNTNLFDIERVEVLFGPQSTLYASASPGGIVNIVTADPKLEGYDGSGSIEYGNYNLLKMEGSMNAPLGDTTALRAAFSSSVHDGYLSNGEDDLDSKAGRLKFLYKPNDKLSIVATGEITKSIGQGYSGTKLFINQDDDTFTDGTNLSDPWTSADESSQSATHMGEKRISLHADYDFGYAGTLTILPSYTRANNYKTGVETMAEGSTEVQADSTLDGKTVEKGLEVRMTSSEDFIFKWIAGANYYSSREEQLSWYYLTEDDDGVIDSNKFNTSETKTKAIYGNITYPVTDLFRVTMGARYSWDEVVTEEWSWDSDVNPDNPYILTSQGPSPMEYSNPDYKVGFEYDLGSNSMLYADWSTSYRLNGVGAAEKILPPEKLKAYTIGAKNRFFGNKLLLNAAAYYYDYKNFFTVGDPVNTLEDDNDNGQWDVGEDEYIQDLGQLTTGDARIYGFDLQTSTIITSKDKLNLSVSYVNKEFKDILFDYYSQTNSLGLEDMSYNGYGMTNAPPWTVTFEYSHNFTLPNGGILTPRVSYKFRSGYLLTWQADQISLVQVEENDGTYSYYYTKVNRSDVRNQEAYRIGDISMLYTNPDGQWTLNFYVKNLENYALKRSLMGMSGDELRLGSPRTYGAVLSVKF